MKNARELIGTALDTCDQSWDQIVSGIAAGHFHLFRNETAALIGEFVVSPRAMGFNVFLGGGDLEGVEALIPEAEAYARSKGADFAGAVGRRGWERVLRRHGYAPEISVQKEL